MADQYSGLIARTTAGIGPVLAEEVGQWGVRRPGREDRGLSGQAEEAMTGGGGIMHQRVTFSVGPLLA